MPEIIRSWHLPGKDTRHATDNGIYTLCGLSMPKEEGFDHNLRLARPMIPSEKEPTCIRCLGILDIKHPPPKTLMEVFAEEGLMTQKMTITYLGAGRLANVQIDGQPVPLLDLVELPRITTDSCLQGLVITTERRLTLDDPLPGNVVIERYRLGVVRMDFEIEKIED